jgi:hypothetical protein
MSSEKDVESKKAYYYYTIKPLDAIEKVDLSLLPYTVEKSEHGLTVIINMADDYENLKQEIERDIKNFFFAYGVLSDLQSVSVKSGGTTKNYLMDAENMELQFKTLLQTLIFRKLK